MDYSVEKIAEMVNEKLDVGLKNGKDIYDFIMFLDDTLDNSFREIKDLTRELTDLKGELDDYRRFYGDGPDLIL